MLASLTHAIKTIDNYYRDQLSSFFTEDEMNMMVNHGKEFWMDSAEMMNRGIATGIIINGEYFTSETYFEKYNKDGEVKKSYLKKAAKAEKKAAKEQAKMLTAMRAEADKTDKTEEAE